MLKTADYVSSVTRGFSSVKSFYLLEPTKSPKWEEWEEGEKAKSRESAKSAEVVKVTKAAKAAETTESAKAAKAAESTESGRVSRWISHFCAAAWASVIPVGIVFMTAARTHLINAVAAILIYFILLGKSSDTSSHTSRSTLVFRHTLIF
jgi:hypothetical protein